MWSERRDNLFRDPQEMYHLLSNPSTFNLTPALRMNKLKLQTRTAGALPAPPALPRPAKTLSVERVPVYHERHSISEIIDKNGSEQVD